MSVQIRPSIKKSATIKIFTLIVAAVMVLTTSAIGFPRAAAAACQTPSPEYGSVTTSVSVPGTAVYRIWSRIMVPDTVNKSYLLEVDGNQCYVVGNGTIAASTWTWVDYRDGNSSSKIDLSLSQGNHTFKLIGSKPDVKLDRIVLTSDTTCTPAGNGDNCNTPADTTSPTVQLTAPANGSTVSGTVNMMATASDNVGVTKVEFYDNSTLVGTDTSSPYSASWNTTQVSNGTHALTAKAYDAATNTNTSGYNVTVQNSVAQPLTHPDGTLIKPQNNPNVYLMVGGQRQLIGSPAVFVSHGFQSSQIKTALSADMNLAQSSSVYFREGVLLRGSGPAVYVVDYASGAPRKRHITSTAAFVGLGYSDADVLKVSDNELPATNGPSINNANLHPDGSLVKAANSPDVYLIDSNQKRLIGSPQVMQSHNYQNTKIRTATSSDSSLTRGADFYFREGTLLKDANPAVYVVDDNSGTFQKRHITSLNTFQTLGYNTGTAIYVVPTAVLPTQNGTALQ